MSYVYGRFYCCKCGHTCKPVHQIIDEDDYDVDYVTSDCCKDLVAEDAFLNKVMGNVKYPRIYKESQS